MGRRVMWWLRIGSRWQKGNRKERGWAARWAVTFGDYRLAFRVEPFDDDEYDAIISVEVLELQEGEEARQAVVNICWTRGDLLFLLGFASDDLSRPAGFQG